LTTGRIVAAHGQFNDTRQVAPPPSVHHPYLTHASMGPPESKAQTASRLVQPFLHS